MLVFLGFRALPTGPPGRSEAVYIQTWAPRNLFQETFRFFSRSVHRRRRNIFTMCGEIESCKSSSYEKEDEVIVGNGNAKSIQMLRNLIIKPRLFPSRANRVSACFPFFAGYSYSYFFFRCFQLPRSLLLSGPRGIGKVFFILQFIHFYKIIMLWTMLECDCRPVWYEQLLRSVEQIW